MTDLPTPDIDPVAPPELPAETPQETPAAPATPDDGRPYDLTEE